MEAAMTNPPWKLGQSFAHLCEDGGVMPVALNDDFWSDGVNALPPGRLISQFRTDADWTVFEMHPDGDEWIYQLSGAIVLILDTDEGEVKHKLRAGEFTIVPKGVWHTADVEEPGESLFITPGEGTQHRERNGS